MTPEKIQEEMLKIAKANNKKFKSIQTNLQIITWITIISVIIAIVAAASLS